MELFKLFSPLAFNIFTENFIRDVLHGFKCPLPRALSIEGGKVAGFQWFQPLYAESLKFLCRRKNQTKLFFTTFKVLRKMI